MINEKDIIRQIFALKVRNKRVEKGFSFQELSSKTGLSVSYLNEIEKGKKYPKTDKIMILADTLEVNYDFLVSLKVNKKLQPIIDIMRSDFFKDFPLEMFGVDFQKAIGLLTHAPDKITAFLATLIKLSNSYDMDRQEFYYNALLSYQELHNNYFPEIEKEVMALKKSYSEEITLEVKSKTLRKILLSRFGITVDRKTIKPYKELKDLRSLFLPEEKVLMLNHGLKKAQTNFLLGKEIGFQTLASKDRPFETPPQYNNTFEQTLNNFKASYFSSALLIDEAELVKDTKDFLARKSWDPDTFLSLLDKYNSTPEMIFQRMTNVLPKVLGMKNLFFMRFVSGLDLNEMVMTKELRISPNQETHVRKLNEHYCRRWISVSGLKKAQSLKLDPDKDIIVDAQISKNWTTKAEFFCISIAFPNVSNDSENISVTIGFLIDANLKKHISFLNDPKLKRNEVNITCERCGITDCNDRVSPPKVLIMNKQKEEIRKSIDRIMKQADDPQN